jgi:mRNA-degrading endonuclease RelE of RelBE toxin-antitoxin system
VKSHTTPRFRKLLANLPPEIRHQAQEAYRKFKANPEQTGLFFKELKNKPGVWSARINDNYRALGVRDGDEITWVWIGTHREYEKRT